MAGFALLCQSDFRCPSCECLPFRSFSAAHHAGKYLAQRLDDAIVRSGIDSLIYSDVRNSWCFHGSQRERHYRRHRRWRSGWIGSPFCRSHLRRIHESGAISRARIRIVPFSITVDLYNRADPGGALRRAGLPVRKGTGLLRYSGAQGLMCTRDSNDEKGAFYLCA